MNKNPFLKPISEFTIATVTQTVTDEALIEKILTEYNLTDAFDGTTMDVDPVELLEFGIAGHIEITESPEKNPYRPDQESVINPTSKVTMLVMDENGEWVPYYRHTSFVTDGAQDQFIGDYSAAVKAGKPYRKWDRSTEEQVAKDQREAAQAGLVEADNYDSSEIYAPDDDFVA